MTQTPSIIVVDNFYSNPMEVREFILKQDFPVTGQFPGYRTEQPYATHKVRDLIQSYIEPFGMEIDRFPLSGDHNGKFQYTTAEHRSWIHTDTRDNMAGVLYMTPDAPFSAGTGFYRPKGSEVPVCHTRPPWERNGLSGSASTPPFFCHHREENYGRDITKWDLVDQVGNVFNRLVLYNSHMWHTSMDYFGDCKENGRLFQVFFFSIKKKDKASNV